MGAAQKPANRHKLQARQADLAAFCKPANSPAQSQADHETKRGNYNFPVGTRCHSCSSQITVDYDAVSPFAVGHSHWKNPYAHGGPHLPLTISKDASISAYRSFVPQIDLTAPLSCPASLSITPVPSYSSSSQETLSQDYTGLQIGHKQKMIVA
ncbi:hypothetical protein Y1Q_0020123 [Alligator mississippiensis]|uniref:Uncharacterized protein n=1 Tax=Alligator mississippiensis TaxID=8496 RepID=A0A151LZ69_ALLMI|nr:hypothetical protein Y1Q_0020123 [Alligator mississippiensis]